MDNIIPPVEKTGHVSTGNAQFVIFNVEGTPTDTKPICWFVRKREQVYSLYKIVEEKYPHPDVPDIAHVTRYEEMHVCSYHEHEPKCAALIVLYAAQENINSVVGRIS